MAGKAANQRVRLTRTLLKNALMELLKRKPLSAIKVKELCEMAELNRTTFYLHYGSPQDVLEDIENDFAGKTEMMMNQISPNISDIDNIQKYLEFIRENAQMYRILILEPQDPGFEKGFLEQIQKIIQYKYAPYVPKNSQDEVYAFMLYGSLGVIRFWMDSNFEKPARDVAQMLYLLEDNALGAVD